MAAGLMGYEEMSNFIDIFKKHHGYSPGNIKSSFKKADSLPICKIKGNDQGNACS